MLFLSGCLAPPSVSDLYDSNSEASKKWTKWHTKWSTYKLGNYPEIKDIMHAVGFSFSSNRLARFALSYDRIYNISGENDLHPSGKLRWISWNSFKEGGKPWRNPIFIDELIHKYHTDLSYQSTMGIDNYYIHHFNGKDGNYYFDNNKLLRWGKIQIVPQKKNTLLVYNTALGELSLGKFLLLKNFPNATLSQLNSGSLLKSKNRQVYIPSDAKTTIEVPIGHTVHGGLNGILYTTSLGIIYKSKSSLFSPKKWRKLIDTEELHMLRNSIIIVTPADLSFTRYSRSGLKKKDVFPIRGKYLFNQLAPSSNSLLFSFENALMSKKLIEYNGTNGEFTTIQSASPSFFSRSISQISFGKNIELYQHKTKKRTRLIVELYMKNSFPKHQYLGDIGRSWLEDLGNYARIGINSLTQLNTILDQLSHKTGIRRKNIGIIVRKDQAVELLKLVSLNSLITGAILIKNATRAISISQADGLPPIYLISGRNNVQSPFPTRMLARELYQLDAEFYFVEKIAKKKNWGNFYQEFKAVRASEFAFFGLHL